MCRVYSQVYLGCLHEELGPTWEAYGRQGFSHILITMLIHDRDVFLDSKIKNAKE